MVRIALISDIHFGKFSRTAEFSVPGEPIKDENTGGESLKESMINILKEKDIKYLCIAGDLTSIGSPQEYNYCKDMLIDLANKLNIQRNNILLGLGNHDIDWKISELYNSFDSSNTDFPSELVKERYRKVAASASLVYLKSIPPPEIKGPAPYSGIIENDDFAMFVLNTGWCCTEEQAISHGKLDSTQLRWFSDEASNYKTVKKWKIILMHHNPINYSYPTPSWDPSLLQESSELLEIAGNNGFHLVIHGHRHHPRAETIHNNNWQHPITFICAGSFAVNASHRSGGSIPNTLHIVELTDELGVIKLLTFQYSSASGWIPLYHNCPETPLDFEMLLGKTFNSSEIEKSISQLTSVEKELKWIDLDECLQFMPYNKLNDLLKIRLENTHKIIGKFPDDVCLIKK